MQQDNHLQDKPPVLGSWKAIYWIVIGFLFVQILLYHFITIWFR